MCIAAFLALSLAGPGIARAVAPPSSIGSPPSLSDAQAAPLKCGDGDLSKGRATSDGDDPAEKLPQRGKVKECCGYPISQAEDFRLSFYWLAYESEYALEPYDTDIYTRDGYWIGRFPSGFVFELKLEGSGILRDGRVLNYDDECPYGIGTCFKTLDAGEHPLGRGVQNRPLVPFRSVAVDPRYIPIGSPIYVPELVGVELPDGTLHDGCLRADDMGGAIKQHKLDYFVESYFNFKFLADQLRWRLKATPHLDEPRCAYLRLNTSRDRDNEHTDWAALHNRKLRQAQAQKARGKKRPWWANISKRGKNDLRRSLHRRHAGNERGHAAGARGPVRVGAR